MNPEAVAVLIPIVAIGGFFALMIVRTFTKAYTAKLQAGSQAGPAHEARQGELAAALEDLRRGVAELAETGDFSERPLAQRREGERLGPPPPGAGKPQGAGGVERGHPAGAAR